MDNETKMSVTKKVNMAISKFYINNISGITPTIIIMNVNNFLDFLDEINSDETHPLRYNLISAPESYVMCNGSRVISSEQLKAHEIIIK